MPRKSILLSINPRKAIRKFQTKLKKNQQGSGFVKEPTQKHNIFRLYINNTKRLAYGKFDHHLKGVYPYVPNQLGVRKPFFMLMVKCDRDLADYLNTWDIEIVKAAMGLNR